VARRSTKSTSTGTGSGTGGGSGGSSDARKPAAKTASAKPRTSTGAQAKPASGSKAAAPGAKTGAQPSKTSADATAKATPKTAAAPTSKAEDKVTAPGPAAEKTAPDAAASGAAAGSKPASPDRAASTPARAGDRPAETSGKATPETATPAASRAPATQAPVRRGGVVPLLLGGVAAGAIGFGAAYFGFAPGRTGANDPTAQTDAQAQEIASLTAEVERLGNQHAVDLTGLEAEIAEATRALADLRDTVTGIEDRVTALEARPVLTGDAEGDTASVVAALDAMQTRLAEQEARNAAMAEDMRRIAGETAANIAAAETRAQASLATARAQATLSQLRAALASGAPFPGLLADLPETVEVPAPLARAAETGVPRLADLQTRFPVAARAALPVAIRETAAQTDGGNRLGAFLRSQLGMRSITPRDGDDPDAVLSRAQAAVSAGNLAAALDEIAALPAGRPGRTGRLGRRCRRPGRGRGRARCAGHHPADPELNGSSRCSGRF